MSSLLIHGGLIVTMNDRFDVIEGDILVRDGRIVSVGDTSPAGETPDRIINARGGFVLPGLIQTHVHLCQTLFRGSADDLPLMDWLRRRVWPLEAAHDERTLRASAQLAAAELLSSGTTAVLTMETVHGTDAVFDAIADTGLRATIGKCMMDRPDAPAMLREDTARSIDESLALHKRWHHASHGRVRAAFAPRFAVSCTRELLEAVAALSREHNVLVHTHAAESRDEIAIVHGISGGLSNVEYLAGLGLASPRLCTAHCVWVDPREQALLAEREVKVMHCPGSNLKLGSGVAPVAELRAAGVTVSLGADGAACNNRLDMFDEMRLAAMLQAMRRGPGTLPAREVLWMATRAGARTLGLESELGSIEAGKRADLIIVNRDAAHLTPGAEVYSTLVYAARGSDVNTTVVDGEILYDAGQLVRMDRAAVLADARAAARELAGRVV
jgi:cytosine/adenosine deaminase-related metal-dependent hydrolase